MKKKKRKNDREKEKEEYEKEQFQKEKEKLQKEREEFQEEKEGFMKENKNVNKNDKRSPLLIRSVISSSSTRAPSNPENGTSFQTEKFSPEHQVEYPPEPPPHQHDEIPTPTLEEMKPKKGRKERFHSLDYDDKSLSVEKKIEKQSQKPFENEIENQPQKIQNPNKCGRETDSENDEYSYTSYDGCNDSYNDSHSE